ncbi:flippase [Ectothiorhodospira mobilis]|uniref:flippase n=1 Tax=Ectothiorhodospira mobilis TaxID=195064 RepID=UPI00190602A2|nr:flippase [Ectothiorhodospira mobilis]MBK1692967.1 flippase [Ectothiorhodospira mobilis]
MISPEFRLYTIRRELTSVLYRRLHKYLNNSFWIMGEKVVGVGLAFFSTVFVARYLGPEDFGSLAYALSLAALFAAAGHMGLSGLVVREIVKNEADRGETLVTAALLKLLGMVAGYAVLLIYAASYEGLGTTEFYLIAFAGAALLFRPMDVVDFWFQAFMQARYTAIARILSYLVTTAFKLALVFAGTGLMYFATAQILQAALSALLLLVFFWLKARVRVAGWRFSWVRAKEFLSQGWLIYLGSIFAVIYLKVDQVMLRWLADTQEVGQYAVAAQISEAWYFIPTAIVASFFPKLIKLREEDEALFKYRLQQLFDALLLIGLIVAVVITIAAPWIIDVFFGSDYVDSASIFVVHIWAAIFIFMRTAFSKWILIENVLVFSLITQGLGAVTNVLLNLTLIPAYGGIGAAYATLLSYAMASFLALFFYRRTRPVFWQMARALLSPIRYSVRLVCMMR